MGRRSSSTNQTVRTNVSSFHGVDFARQGGRYFLAGILGLAYSTTVFLILSRFVDSLTWGPLIVFLIGASWLPVAYQLNAFFVFRKKNSLRSFSSFVLVHVFANIVLPPIVFQFFSSFFSYSGVTTFFLTTPTSALLGFVLLKVIVFGQMQARPEFGAFSGRRGAPR